MRPFYLITGCSSGGKSTLIAALAARGHRVVEEPGRRIVAEEEAGTGAALPWVDEAAFARRAVDMARADLAPLNGVAGPVFFDRGLLDAAAALEHSSGVPLAQTMGREKIYGDPVFLAPPWPEIHVRDAARQHGIGAATEEFERLVAACARLGYRTCELPKESVKARVAFVEQICGLNEPMPKA